jgi:predicted transcriptional regulator
LNVTQTPGNSTEVFFIDIAFNGLLDNGVMTVNSAYKNSPVCIGNLAVRNCTLRRAKVRYSIAILNGTVTIDPLVLGRNDTVEMDYTGESFDTTGLGNWYNTIGGIWIGAYSLFQSLASVYDGGYPYDLFLGVTRALLTRT